MSRSLEYTFPAANEKDVCLLQTVVGGGDLNLNGLLINSTGTKVSFIERGYSRSVSFTSVNDLSLHNFTVLGVQNGVKIEAAISGPNGNTVYTTEVFDEITEVRSDLTVNDVSVGTGTFGFFPLIGINLERPLIDYALSLSTSNLIGMGTVIYSTLDDLDNNGKSFQSNVATNKNLFILKPSSADDNYIIPPAEIRMYKSLLIEIIGDEFDINTEIQMKFIQI